MPNLNLVKYIPETANIIKLLCMPQRGECEILYEAEGEVHEVVLVREGAEWVRRPVVLH